MIVNLIISILLSLLSVLPFQNNKKLKKVIIIVITVILGLYYRLTTSDWVAYRLLYEEVLPKLSLELIVNSRLIFNMDRGFVILSYFFHNLGISYNIFQSFILGSCIFYILYFLKEKKGNFYIAIIFLLSNFFNLYISEPILRQLIAITIVMFGIYYIEKKLFLKYLLIILIAAQFHLSAVICIFFYLFNFIKINLNRSILIFIVSFLLFSNIGILFKGVTLVFPSLSHYYTYIKYNNIVDKSVFTYIRIVFLIIIYILCLRNKPNNIYTGLTLVYLVLVINKDKLFLLGRLDGYFLIPAAIYFSNIDKYFIKILFNFFNILLLCYYLSLNKNSLEYKNYLIVLLKGKNSNEYIQKEKSYRSIKKEVYRAISSISK